MQDRPVLKSSRVAPIASNAAAADGPIRIGLMAPLTGVAANGGKETVEGATLFRDQVGNRLGARSSAPTRRG